MTRLPLPLLLALSVSAGACAPEPGGTDVSEHNYAATRMRDAQAATCHHEAIEAEIEDTMIDLGLVACNVAIGTSTDGVQMITSKRLTDFAPKADQPLFTPPNIDFAWDTPMNAGSVSKMVTAQAFLQLWAEGHVAIEYVEVSEGVFEEQPAPLDSILVGDVLDHPDSWPFWMTQITVKELLGHQSGIDEMDLGKTRWEWFDEDDKSVLLNGGWTTISDDESTLDLPAGALTGISAPGNHPRFAYRALVPPASADYDNAVTNGQYSNVNYLLLAAIIDEIVTEPGFDGYGSGAYKPGGMAGLEAGFESYAWWVASHGATQKHDSLLTPALQSENRVSSASIPGFPLGYGNESDVLVGYAKWGGSGYEAPAGGWTMTIGDQLRLVHVVANSNAPGIRLHPDAAKKHIQKIGNVDGVGDYAGGVQQLKETVDGVDYDLRGHGGGIWGYTGGAYHVYTPATRRLVAIACNTDPRVKLGDGTYESVVYYPGLAARIVDAWGSTDPTCDPVVAPGLTPGEGTIADDYWPSWSAAVNDSIERYGHAATVKAWEKSLDDKGYGTLAIDAFDDGDYAQAAECALKWTGDRSGRWTCK